MTTQHLGAELPHSTHKPVATDSDADVVLIIGSTSETAQIVARLAAFSDSYRLMTASTAEDLPLESMTPTVAVVLVSLLSDSGGLLSLQLLDLLKARSSGARRKIGRVIGVCNHLDAVAYEGLQRGCNDIAVAKTPQGAGSEASSVETAEGWKKLADLIAHSVALSKLSSAPQHKSLQGQARSNRGTRRAPTPSSELHRSRNRGAMGAPKPPGQVALDRLIGLSDPMKRLRATIEKVAAADINVLICGETGTGKELVAQAIHYNSKAVDPLSRGRIRTGPLVAINCAAIPDNLLESELFGHERGAFTGALGRKPGKIELANGGTLFLDEIGDMPAALQAKLLRFIEDRHIERVGGTQRIPVDIRIVAATHQNIAQQIIEGEFREDLYYRLAEITLTLPPLRKRDNDVLLIARHLLSKYAKRTRFSDDAIIAITHWHWPGNVRELENILKRACLLAGSDLIEAKDLELFDVARRNDRLPLAAPVKAPVDLANGRTRDNMIGVVRESVGHAGDSAASDTAGTDTELNLQEVRRQSEQNAIIRAFARAGDNVSKAAKLLGVTRPTLYNLMEKHDIKTRSDRPSVDGNAQRT